MATMRPQRSKNLLCSLIMSCVSSVGGAEGTSGGVGKLFVKTEQDVALQEFEARLNQPRL